MADQETKEAGNDPEAGKCCPKCQAAQVVPLRANFISPRPGYRCRSCGTRMRGMTGTYVVAAALGLLLLSVAAGIFKPLGDPSADASIRGLVVAPMGPGSSYFAVPFYLIMVGYAIRELTRPRPRRV